MPYVIKGLNKLRGTEWQFEKLSDAREAVNILLKNEIVVGNIMTVPFFRYGVHGYVYKSLEEFSTENVPCYSEVPGGG